MLSEYGLEYKFSIINQSQKQLPISVATHTTISAPFVDGAKEEDIRIQAPVVEKWTLNERCLPTGEILPLSDYDKAYLNGTTCPVKRIVDNDMYTAGKLSYRGKPFRGVLMTDTASKRVSAMRYRTATTSGFCGMTVAKSTTSARSR